MSENILTTAYEQEKDWVIKITMDNWDIIYSNIILCLSPVLNKESFEKLNNEQKEIAKKNKNWALKLMYNSIIDKEETVETWTINLEENWLDNSEIQLIFNNYLGKNYYYNKSLLELSRGLI